MGFPRFYRELKEMMENELIETPLARQIARKAGVRSFADQQGAPTGNIEVDLLQEFAKVTRSGLDHSQYGALLPYRTGGNWLPPDSARMVAYWDFRDVTSFRLTANVSEPAASGMVVYLRLWQEIDTDPFRQEVFFDPATLEFPVDAAGFFDTGWRDALWYPTASFGRFGQIEWYLSDPPDGEGTFGLGLVQLLIKKEGV